MYFFRFALLNYFSNDSEYAWVLDTSILRGQLLGHGHWSSHVLTASQLRVKERFFVCHFPFDFFIFLEFISGFFLFVAKALQKSFETLRTCTANDTAIIVLELLFYNLCRDGSVKILATFSHGSYMPSPLCGFTLLGSNMIFFLLHHTSNVRKRVELHSEAFRWLRFFLCTLVICVLLAHELSQHIMIFSWRVLPIFHAKGHLRSQGQ